MSDVLSDTLMVFDLRVLVDGSLKKDDGKYLWGLKTKEAVSIANRIERLTAERDAWHAMYDAQIAIQMAAADPNDDEGHADAIEQCCLAKEMLEKSGVDPLSASLVNQIGYLRKQCDVLLFERDAAVEREGRLREDLDTAHMVALKAPELNPSNYDHDQVCELNTAMCEVFSILDGLLKENSNGE